jgi:hypothetical protein
MEAELLELRSELTNKKDGFEFPMQTDQKLYARSKMD